MSLAHVLLTSLLEKPSTGIELARRFDRSMGFFWHATHQQIYRELGLMSEKQWITTIDTADSDSRKKTYQVQAAGLQALNTWILAQGEPSKVRDELMVKLRAEAQLGGNLILDELERHLALHLAKLELYQNIYHRDVLKQQNSTTALDATEKRASLIQQKILQLGIQFEQGWITWLTEMRDILT